MERKEQKDINLFNKGLHTDTNEVLQPKGSYKFALNTIANTEEGNIGLLSNEPSNIECGELPIGFKPIGKCYIGDNETCLFLVNPETRVSEIGVFKDCKYQTYVNDKETPIKDKLNFSIEHQIQATYRLRRGCEKNVYWTDGLNNPKVVDLNNLNKYKNHLGRFISSKFNIFKALSILPVIDKSNTKIIEGGGSLKSGSYSIYIQYLDSDFNPTRYVELINNINIYTDSLQEKYSDIRGSIYMVGEDKEDYQYEDSNKGIQLDIIYKDVNFSYLRYAIVEYTSGSGQASRVVLSEILPIDNSRYVYTGSNGVEQGSLEEIKLYGEALDIDTAEHIEQLHNRLILANTKGKTVNLEVLQHYASKIQADCRLRSVNLNDLGDPKRGYNNIQNPKHPLYNSNGIGYMPGEVYAFGITYLYEDGTNSPVFHIPGKSNKVSFNKIYDRGQGIYPMSNKNNESSIRYSSNALCKDKILWGEDCEGESLEGKLVRFHRFPTRDEIGVDFITREKKENNDTKEFLYTLEILGNPKPSVVCKEGETDCTPYTAKPFKIKLIYTINELPKEINLVVNPDDSNVDKLNFSELFTDLENIEKPVLAFFNEENKEGKELEVKEITYEEYKERLKHYDGEQYIELGDTKISYDDKFYITEEIEGIQFCYYISDGTTSKNKENNYTQIMGIHFSNVLLPSEEELGKNIIGYQIVRLDRKDSDKTIIDSAVLLPLSKYDKTRKVATAALMPEVDRQPGSKIVDFLIKIPFLAGKVFRFPNPYSPDNYITKSKANLISLEHKFNNKTPDALTGIKHIGNFTQKSRRSQASILQDVLSGSSADGINTTSGTSDGDGWSLKTLFRFVEVQYRKLTNTETRQNIDFLDDNNRFRLYNLNAVNYNESMDEVTEIVNPSMDERMLVIDTNKDLFNTYHNAYEVPYVYLTKEHNNFYTDFRSQKYITCTPEVFISNKVDVFGGDTHISPLRLSSTLYLSTYQAIRRQSQSWFKRWLGPILGGIGIILAPFTAGTSLGLLGAVGVGLIGAAGILYGISAMVATEKFNSVYGEKWEKGLSVLCRDKHIQWAYVDPDQPRKFERQLMYEDDTIGWFTDSVGDLWFESTVNSNLRIEPKQLKYLLRPQDKYPDEDSISIINAIRVIRKKVGETSLFKWEAERAYVYPDSDVPGGRKEINILNKKITKPKQNGRGVEYTGIPYPNIYMINPDYNYILPIKYYYMIPLTYNLCSDCKETFPHRVYYSEQSFQEEITDNYQMFKANNYRDIEGETGEITNIFRYNNNLYIHTEEALWLQPSSLQERVTGDIVTFIGTGSFFEVPPQKLIDDETGLSAGTIHKWASIKTPVGYYFISANNKSIYQFDGKTPKPISNKGISKWFNENISTLENNPSNIESSGYISTYDSENYRVIFTQVNGENSWTISYSPILESWISYHSYTPNFYFNALDRFYSWVDNNRNIWRHNNWGNYQTYYNELYPHIVEYVVNTSPIQTKIWNDITIQTKAQVYNSETKTYVEDLYTTFNKGIIYNDRQTTGELNLIVKDDSLYDENYLINQVESSLDNISIIDRTEKNWFINDFRDIRVDYNQPIWRKVNKDIQKELNTNSLDIYKDWTQLESFRDKYLGVRLIFDKFADRNLITKFTYESESLSSH